MRIVWRVLSLLAVSLVAGFIGYLAYLLIYVV